MARAVVARAEGGRLRVVGRGETTLAADAVVGGLVVEPRVVTAAVASALGAAERGVPSERMVIAIDGDDVRTYHVKTPFDREESGTPIVRAEADRAVREAREEAAHVAQTAVADDPALRGVATARLTDDVAGLVLDGRELDSVEGYHGRALEVHTDVAVAPLVGSGAARSPHAKRRGRTMRSCGPRSSRSRSAPKTRCRRSGGSSSACPKRFLPFRTPSRGSSARLAEDRPVSARSRRT